MNTSRTVFNRLFFTLALFFCSGLLLSAQEGYTLRIEVGGLESSKGQVIFSLYDKEDAIPDKKLENHLKMKKEKISGDSSSAIFTDIEAGTYAISILHDEDGDGKITKGMLLPKEGIGFSNLRSIGPMNKPNFEKASFELKKDTTIRVEAVYLGK